MSVQSQSGGVKAAIQRLGSHLSSMVMPNIGAFIAWGVITALFIETGWMPNANLAELVGPMQTFLLPILIGYGGGQLVYGQRGGVVGAIATTGVIIGSDVPMFIGAMVMGPLGGWLIKKFDDNFGDKIPQGFEMLVNNFSSGFIGFILAILGYLAIGPLVGGLTNAIAEGVAQIINWGALPLVNLLVEPAKILFLNNAINHGIFTPIGAQQVQEFGKSILYLVETNPGPGLGVLLAFLAFGKGSAKSSSLGAMIIHFLGGIHEIYFPYVLMKPLMILAVIFGGMAGTFTFQLFGVGLSGPASPGSIIAILGMTPQGNFLGVVSGVAAATIVSFIVGSLILKFDNSGAEDDFEEQQARVSSAKAESKGQAAQQSNAATSDSIPNASEIKQIIFACDAGMGSSAMGASLLRKKAKKIGLDMSITNIAVRNLSDDASTLVITQEELTPRARQTAPSSKHISVENFLDGDRYDMILNGMLNPTASSESSDNNASSNVATTTEATNADEVNLNQVGHIYFAYEGKLGAASMGASLLRNALTKANFDIEVLTLPITEISDQSDNLVIGTAEVIASVNAQKPQVQTIVLQNLLDENAYQKLVQ